MANLHTVGGAGGQLVQSQDSAVSLTAAGIYVALAILCGCRAEAPYLVRRVIDGDTFEVEGPGGARMRCRLRRGDAPERGEPGFEQAKAALESRLLGRRVRLRVHARDSYGRAIVTIEPRL